MITVMIIIRNKTIMMINNNEKIERNNKLSPHKIIFI